MAEKLFNEYYTKNFELPGRFTALNGAIQYFTLDIKNALVVKPQDADKLTDEEVAKMQAARANYLRALEVLRSDGAQPIITSVEDTKIKFTLEQTWVYGERGPKQVSAHYGKIVDEATGERSGLVEDAYAGLVDGAIENIKRLFKNIRFFEAKSEEVDGKTVWTVVEKETADEVEPTIEVTAGSLNANE